MTTDPSRRVTHDRAWDRVAQVALGAYLAAIVILIGLGIADLAGANPSGSWLIEAVALIAFGTVVLVVTIIRRRRRAATPRRAATAPARTAPTPPPASASTSASAPARAELTSERATAGASAQASEDPAPDKQPAQEEPPPPLFTWQCQADATTPGVVLFVLYPSRGTPPAGPSGPGSVPRAEPPPLPSSRDLGPVACYVADPTNVGQRAADDRISRARGVFTTRWHPAFFPGVPEPVSGFYRFRWDELRDGEWHLLTTGTEWVNYRPAPAEPVPEPSEGGPEPELQPEAEPAREREPEPDNEPAASTNGSPSDADSPREETVDQPAASAEVP